MNKSTNLSITESLCTKTAPLINQQSGNLSDSESTLTTQTKYRNIYKAQLPDQNPDLISDDTSLSKPESIWTTQTKYRHIYKAKLPKTSNSMSDNSGVEIESLQSTLVRELKIINTIIYCKFSLFFMEKRGTMIQHRLVPLRA